MLTGQRVVGGALRTELWLTWLHVYFTSCIHACMYAYTFLHKHIQTQYIPLRTDLLVLCNFACLFDIISILIDIKEWCKI